MAMMNGNKLTFYAALFLLGVALAKNSSYKKIEQKNSNPTINQYLNRLKEFYSQNDLVNVSQQFAELVNMGMSPQGAFEAIAIYGELN